MSGPVSVGTTLYQAARYFLTTPTGRGGTVGFLQGYHRIVGGVLRFFVHAALVFRAGKDRNVLNVERRALLLLLLLLLLSTL